MVRRHFASLAAASGLAALIVCLADEVQGERTLSANSGDYLADTDGDLLPDVVEWAVLTHDQLSDSDGDGIGDFLEVVQFGAPLQYGQPMAQEHEMRPVITLEVGNNGQEFVWVHLLFRFMGSGTSQLQGLVPWVSTGGQVIPFSISPSLSGFTVKAVMDPLDGVMVIVSTRLVDLQTFHALLPCTVGADAQIGAVAYSAGTYLGIHEAELVHLVPLGPKGFALHSPGRQGGDSSQSGYTNKICVIQLEEVGTSSAGTVYEAVDPDCEPASGLRCSVRCKESGGWTIILPKGVTTITGG